MDIAPTSASEPNDAGGGGGGNVTEEPLTLPVSSPLSVDGVALDIPVVSGTGSDVIAVDNNNDNNSVNNAVRDINVVVDKDEDFVPDTPTSCNSINTIQVWWFWRWKWNVLSFNVLCLNVEDGEAGDDVGMMVLWASEE